MADLIDRIAGTDDSRPKINLHRFIGAERLYALGEWTAAQLVAEFDLQGDELTQANQLKTKIDGETGAANKTLYILRVESVLMCLEDGSDRLYHDAAAVVNKTKVYEDLQIAG